MKKLARKLFWVLMPIFMGVLAINLYVDPGEIVRDRSAQIAKIILSGKNAGIRFIPASWAKLQLAIVDGNAHSDKPIRREILTFGTSRTAEIDSTFFPRKVYFNCAMQSSNLLEYVALYQAYKEAGLLPRYLIIGLDPWTFHSRVKKKVAGGDYFVADTIVPLHASANLRAHLIKGLQTLGVSEKWSIDRSTAGSMTERLSELSELFSPSYLQTSVHSWSRIGIVSTIQDRLPDYLVIHADGSYSMYSPQEIDSMWVKTEVNQFMGYSRGNFLCPRDTGKVYIGHFKLLLTEMKKDGIIPIVFIAPLNPIAYDNLIRFETNSVEEKVRKICAAISVPVLGSFNPHLYDIDHTGKYFTDAYHPVKTVITRIFLRHRAELSKIGLELGDMQTDLPFNE
jgi:hypothetical protein